MNHSSHLTSIANRIIVASIATAILSLSLSNGLVAQTDKLDSLRLLSHRISDKNFCDITYNRSLEFMVEGRYDSAFKYTDILQRLGERDRDSLQIVRAIATRASTLRRAGLLDSAMNLYKLVLPISKRLAYVDQSMNILNSMGNLYMAEARYDIALQCHFESLRLREEIADEFAISVAAHNIGFVYYKIGNPDKAISYYLKALQLKKKIENKHDIEHLLLNIGWCYIDKKDFRSANEYFDNAFASCADSPSDNFLMDAFLGMGYIAKGQEAFDKAEEYFLKSYSIAKRNNDFRHVLDNIGQLSEIYIARNEKHLAEKYLSEAEALVINDDRYRLELANIYHLFSDLYGSSNDLERKVHFQEKYIALKDSIFNHQVTTNLMKAESEFVERENKARIDTQNKILELNNEIIFQQQIANISFGLVALFGIVIAVILALRNKAKQIANKRLDEKVAERTRELRSSHEYMQRTLEEKSMLVHKTTSELHSLIATTKGLCFLGSQEIDISRCQEYWRRLDATTDGMRSTIAKLTESRENIHAALMQN